MGNFIRRRRRRVRPQPPDLNHFQTVPMEQYPNMYDPMANSQFWEQPFPYPEEPMPPDFGMSQPWQSNFGMARPPNANFGMTQPYTPNFNMTPQLYNPNLSGPIRYPTNQSFSMTQMNMPSTPKPMPMGPPVLIGTSTSFPLSKGFSTRSGIPNIITDSDLYRAFKRRRSRSRKKVFEIKIPSNQANPTPPARPLLIQIVDTRTRPNMPNSNPALFTGSPSTLQNQCLLQNQMQMSMRELSSQNSKLMRRNRELRKILNDYRRYMRTRNNQWRRAPRPFYAHRYSQRNMDFIKNATPLQNTNRATSVHKTDSFEQATSNNQKPSILKKSSSSLQRNDSVH